MRLIYELTSKKVHPIDGDAENTKKYMTCKFIGGPFADEVWQVNRVKLGETLLLSVRYDADGKPTLLGPKYQRPIEWDRQEVVEYKLIGRLRRGTGRFQFVNRVYMRRCAFFMQGKGGRCTLDAAENSDVCRFHSDLELAERLGLL